MLSTLADVRSLAHPLNGDVLNAALSINHDLFSKNSKEVRIRKTAFGIVQKIAGVEN